MPQRAYGLLLGLTGLVAVAGLLLVGADVWLASGRGPRWKRSLLAAGLALGSWLGLISCASSPAGVAPATGAPASARGSGAPSAGSVSPGAAFEPFPLAVGEEPEGGDEGKDPGGARLSPRDERLAASPKWNEFAALLAEAREVAAGRRGAYPFRADEKKRLLSELEAASDLLWPLRAEGLLTTAEEAFLAGEIAALAVRVRGFRPFEMRMATCYEPVVPPDPFRASLDTLRQRLELLEKIAAQGELSAKVVRKVLGSAEAHLKTLSAGLEKDPAPDGKEPPERALREKVAGLLERIRGAAPPDRSAGSEAPLANHPAWGRFQGAWSRGKVFVASAQSGTKPLKAEREAAEKPLAAAAGDLRALSGDETLSASEAALLDLEREGLRGAVRAVFASDEPPVPVPTCYTPTPTPKPTTTPTPTPEPMPT
ncbi:MAG: hypothetical protein MUC63_07865, partial [Planctomycetes bacterium]|nr:hypothetical protein [Planctomycetota bacterium]